MKSVGWVLPKRTKKLKIYCDVKRQFFQKSLKIFLEKVITKNLLTRSNYSVHNLDQFPKFEAQLSTDFLPVCASICSPISRLYSVLYPILSEVEPVDCCTWVFRCSSLQWTWRDDSSPFRSHPGSSDRVPEDPARKEVMLSRCASMAFCLHVGCSY